MEKINLVEILKDCPTGMELDCTMFDNVSFEGLNPDGYPIKIKVKGNDRCMYLTENGCWNKSDNAKCIIFPKGKTTWEGFVPPCKFKAGDVLFVDCADKESDGDLYKFIFILKEIKGIDYFSYCYLNINGFFSSPCYLFNNIYTPRLATKEEKAKIFNAIKENGYKWNAETKTLEKLAVPNFKIGNRIKSKINNSVYTITDIRENVYIIKLNDNYSYHIPFTNETNYELIPNKFDITTLKPFDKVLIRNSNAQKWIISFYSHCNNDSGKYKYFCINNTMFAQCIPYENNEHLLNKRDACSEYYKTWE